MAINTDHNTNTLSASSGDIQITAAQLGSYTETVHLLGTGSSGTVDFVQSIHHIITNANTTITIPAPVAGKSFQLQIKFGGAHTVGFTVTGGSSILGSYTASSTSGKYDILNFVATADGANWVVAPFQTGV